MFLYFVPCPCSAACARGEYITKGRTGGTLAFPQPLPPADLLFFFWKEVHSSVVVGMLPRPYCPEELLAAGSAQSVYGMIAGYDDALIFEEGQDGKVMRCREGCVGARLCNVLIQHGRGRGGGGERKAVPDEGL